MALVAIAANRLAAIMPTLAKLHLGHERGLSKAADTN